jgi:hypothetical protein
MPIPSNLEKHDIMEPVKDVVSKKHAPQDDSHPAAIMARLLRCWVEKESASQAYVQTWLCGYDLPPIGGAADDEPFLWLLRGCTGYPEGRKALANVVQVLLSERLAPPYPEQKDRYWLNLVWLADGLQMPSLLKTALQDFAHSAPLEGKYRGISLRKASLKAAGLPAEAPAESAPIPPFPPIDQAPGDPCFEFLVWLDTRRCRAEDLAAWLSGRLPFREPAPYAREQPYVRLIGIPLGSKYASRKIVLAEAAAQLLDDKMRHAKLDKEGKRIVHNLLLLCAELRLPDVLCAPLKAWLSKDRLPKNLRKDLRTAILNNQRDNSLKEVWLDMLRGKEFPILPADARAALEAIRLMPASPDKPGLWDTETIGEALRIVADYTTFAEFDDLLKEIDETYPNLEYGAAIGACAGRNWPAWAIGALWLHLARSPKSTNGTDPLVSCDRWFKDIVVPELQKKGLSQPPKRGPSYAPAILASLKDDLPNRSLRENANVFVSYCLPLDEMGYQDQRQKQNVKDVHRRLMRERFALTV